MSAFGKVSYSENENIAVETVSEEMEQSSVVEQQVEKFDTNFNSDKLQELYQEYDKITIDEEKIKSLTQVKTNAVSTRVPFRVALAMGTTLAVTILLAFLCIYNVFVINGMGSSISYLQEEVISYEQTLAQAEGLYNELTDPEVIKQELQDMGYSEISSSNIVAISVGEKAEVVELQGETNWFDAVCNFLSRVFG
ncbi:MAG: hypothetical protein IJW59_02160 [Clostridia bacterium]|nr:hypothetical protein [Clostridia bacterium]